MAGCFWPIFFFAGHRLPMGVRHFRGPGESTPRSERPKIPPSDH